MMSFFEKGLLEGYVSWRNMKKGHKLLRLWGQILRPGNLANSRALIKKHMSLNG